MSYSICIKCEKMVGLYQKYCPECVALYGVEQDEYFHRERPEYGNWDDFRKRELENDLGAATPPDKDEE